MMKKIPTTVITGFLGSGKTTLVRHLLEHSGDKKIALIINEFGDLGVDGGILKGCGNENCTDEDVVELSNGCICCTVADDFVPTMQMLIAREPRPDHIIIETSGLALPQPLVRAFNWPEISTKVTVDGVVSVIDGRAVVDGQFAHNVSAVDAQRAQDDNLDHETPLSELFEDQVACADLIVINKADLLSGDEQAGLMANLKSQAREGVQVVSASHGALPFGVVLGQDMAAETDLSVRHEKHHHHHEEEHSDHHHHDHDHDAFESFVVERGDVTSVDAFKAQVERVIIAHGVLRLKGFVGVQGKPLRLTLQAVGPRIETYFDKAFDQGERYTRLVVIGQRGLDRAAIAQALQD